MYNLQIGSERITSGPEGTVANMLRSITRLLTGAEFMSPDATNAIKLQSLLTLVEENIHVTMKMKHPAPSLLDYMYYWDFGKAKLVCQILHPPEILLSHSRACNGSFCYCKIKSHSSPWTRQTLQRWGNGRVNMGSVFDSLLLGSKQQNVQLAHCPCQPMGQTCHKILLTEMWKKKSSKERKRKWRRVMSWRLQSWKREMADK